MGLVVTKWTWDEKHDMESETGGERQEAAEICQRRFTSYCCKITGL